MCDGPRSRENSNHDPRKEVAKNFLLNKLTGATQRFAIGLYEVDHDLAIARPQHAGRNFDNARKGGRVAHRSDTFAVPRISPEVFYSSEHARQRLPVPRKI